METKRLRRITCVGVSIFACLCSFFTVPIIGVLAVAIQRGLLEQIQWQTIDVAQWMSLLFTLSIAAIFLIFFGSTVSALFTKIRVTPQGIEYESFLRRGVIKLEEIVTITSSKWFATPRLLVIQRKGASFLRPKGLLLQFIHGIWFGIYKPIIVLWENDRTEENQILELKKLL